MISHNILLCKFIFLIKNVIIYDNYLIQYSIISCLILYGSQISSRTRLFFFSNLGRSHCHYHQKIYPPISLLKVKHLCLASKGSSFWIKQIDEGALGPFLLQNHLRWKPLLQVFIELGKTYFCLPLTANHKHSSLEQQLCNCTQGLQIKLHQPFQQFILLLALGLGILELRHLN